MTLDLCTLRIGDYLAALASDAPTPGGGSAAALAGSLAASLGTMVVSVAQARERNPERESLAEQFRNSQNRLVELATEDERAFADVMYALRTPKADPARRERLQATLERAAAVAVEAAGVSIDVLRSLLLAVPHASRSIASDVGVAAYLASAAAYSSILTARANSAFMPTPEPRALLADTCERFAAEVDALRADVVSRVERRLVPPTS